MLKGHFYLSTMDFYQVSAKSINYLLIAEKFLNNYCSVLKIFFVTGSCNEPLGMESGAIPDEAISASSSYVQNVGPKNGR